MDTSLGDGRYNATPDRVRKKLLQSVAMQVDIRLLTQVGDPLFQ